MRTLCPVPYWCGPESFGHSAAGVATMRRVRLLFALLLGLAVAVPATAAASPSQAPANPTLVGIRAAQHPGFDRIVYDFAGGLPTHVNLRYVRTLTADGSGLPVRIAGRAILELSMFPAQAHVGAGVSTAPGRLAFPYKNIMTTVRSGDFEGYVTYGIGLANRTKYTVTRLTNPDRVVVDSKTAFTTTAKRMWLLNQPRFIANTSPFFTPRNRPVRTSAPATGVMDRIFAGPTEGEKALGLRLVRSRATGFTKLRISDAVARVQLTGGCSSGGSTVTIAGEIMPSLRQFPSVRWVKIYDPSGQTERPWGHTDSIPTCLEP